MPSPSPIRCLSLPRKCVVLLIYLTWMLNDPVIGHPENHELQYLTLGDLFLLPSSQPYTWGLYSPFDSSVISCKEATSEAQGLSATVRFYSWRRCLAAVALLTGSYPPVLMNLLN